MANTKYREGKPPLLARSPLLILGAAALALVESALAFALGPVDLASVGVLVVAFCVVALLLRGSRLAWLFVVFFAVAQLLAPLVMGRPAWVAGLGAVLFALLVNPSVIDYFWTDRRADPSATLGHKAGHVYKRCIDALYSWAARLPGLGSELENEAASRVPSLRRLGLALAVWIFVFFPLVGALNNLRHGSARGDEAVDLFWHVSWIAWNLVAVLLVVLLIVAYRRRRSPRR